MRKLAGYGIIAGMLGLALVLFFLLGGDWVLLGAMIAVFGGLGAWCAGLVLGTWLWDNVHWSLGVLVLVLTVVVAPPLILPLANMPWWLAYGLYGFSAGVLGAAVGIGLLLTYAMDLIRGEK